MRIVSVLNKHRDRNDMTSDVNDDTTTPDSFLDFLHFAFEQTPKTRAEIAREMGYRNENVVNMMLGGVCKVPIDKIPRLAKALNVEVTQMMTLAMEEYCPSILRAIEETFEFLATPNEREFVKVVRHISNNTDPRLPLELREIIEAYFRNNVVTEG